MRIAFYSTIGQHSWGGSEELWSRAALELLERGHQVAFCTAKCPPLAPQLQRLIDKGGQLSYRGKRRMSRRLRKLLQGANLIRPRGADWLRKVKPEVVVISLSCHTDHPIVAHACQHLGIPYILVIQAANPITWVSAKFLDEFRFAYQHARQVLFVSAENRETMEANLQLDLSHGEVVDNPFVVRPDAAPAWPAAEPLWKLAMVARVNFGSKSHDLVMRVLSQPKWRSRPLKVNCWGSDDGSLGELRRLIDFYSLQNQFEYCGFARDIEKLWAEHHALLLPSRYEGNALALIEAMLCGRMAITTDVGRATELIDDGESGFVAPAASVGLIDEVLERAWQRRHLWQAMGQRAAQVIRQRHSLKPAIDFAERILAVNAERVQAVRKAA